MIQIRVIILFDDTNLIFKTEGLKIVTSKTKLGELLGLGIPNDTVHCQEFSPAARAPLNMQRGMAKFAVVPISSAHVILLSNLKLTDNMCFISINSASGLIIAIIGVYTTLI